MRFLVRADASSLIGNGHVMRCIALAQRFREMGHEGAFLMTESTSSAESALTSASFSCLRSTKPKGGRDDAKNTIQIARETKADLIIADGYHFSFDFQRLIREAAARLLVIDDNGELGRYASNWILNHNIHASEGLYTDREPSARLMLGPSYALLRKEFDAWSDYQRGESGKRLKLLVTLGGSDCGTVIKKILQAFAQIPADQWEAVVIAGKNNKDYSIWTSMIEDARLPVRLENEVPAISQMMAWSDLIIAGAGVTCLEAAFMRLPTLMVILADNQLHAAQAWQKAGAGRILGWHSDLTVKDIVAGITEYIKNPSRLSTMSRVGREIVDGRGAYRVFQAMAADIKK